MKDEIVIDGVTYVKKTTEPVKRERKKWFLGFGYARDKNLDYGKISAFFYKEDPRKKGGTLYNVGEWYDVVEFRDGDIVISKEDFDLAINKIKAEQTFHMSEWPAFIKQELFK